VPIDRGQQDRRAAPPRGLAGDVLVRAGRSRCMNSSQGHARRAAAEPVGHAQDVKPAHHRARGTGPRVIAGRDRASLDPEHRLAIRLRGRKSDLGGAQIAGGGVGVAEDLGGHDQERVAASAEPGGPATGGTRRDHQPRVGSPSGASGSGGGGTVLGAGEQVPGAAVRGGDRPDPSRHGGGSGRCRSEEPGQRGHGGRQRGLVGGGGVVAEQPPLPRVARPRRAPNHVLRAAHGTRSGFPGLSGRVGCGHDLPQTVRDRGS